MCSNIVLLNKYNVQHVFYSNFSYIEVHILYLDITE